MIAPLRKLQVCTEVQGYLFSRPRPASELGDIIGAGGAKQTAVA